MDETHQPGLAEVTIIEDSDADDRCDLRLESKYRMAPVELVQIHFSFCDLNRASLTHTCNTPFDSRFSKY